MSAPKTGSVNKLITKAVRALKQNQLEDAAQISMQVLAQDAEHIAANTIAFTSLFKLERFEEARRIGGKAASLNPTSEYILNNQACLQLDAKQPAAAAALLKSLIEQYGERAQWMYNLGLAQRMAGGLHKAQQFFQNTLSLDPRHDRAAFQLADVSNQLGQSEVTSKQLNYLRLLRPNDPATHSLYVAHAAHSNNLAPVALEQEMRLWSSQYILADKQYSTSSLPNNNALTIGFSVGQIPHQWWQLMVAPLINQLSVNDNVIVYSHQTRQQSSGIATGVELVNSSTLSDADYARRVRADKVDVLIDVAGMRLGCRQRALGLQLASRQFGWLAHEGMYATNTVTVIEPLLGKQRFCFSPAANVESTNNISPLGSVEKTLFASNSTHGMSRHNLNSIAEALYRLPDWKLKIDAMHSDLQNQYRLRFAKRGILGSRLTFDQQLIPTEQSIVIENMNSNDVLKSYHALCAGAKVIALNGILFPAQQTAALLKTIDQPDWVVKSSTELVEKVVSLSQEQELKNQSAASLSSSKLNDFKSFASHFRDQITH